MKTSNSNKDNNMLQFIFDIQNEYDSKIHTTIDTYLEKYPLMEDKLFDIVKKCNGSWSRFHYIIYNKNTIMVYSYFSNRPYTYAVEAIYTEDKKRNKGSAKELLRSLSFFGDLYFDTYTDELINILNCIGAKKEEVFKNKGSSQFILEIDNKISKKLR